MKDLPIVFKGILNILLFVFYVVIVSFAFSFLFPLMLQVLWKPVLDSTNPIFIKIQIFIFLLVLVVSVVLRRYFYITTGGKPKEKIIQTKTIDVEDGLDIKIEKEIK